MIADMRIAAKEDRDLNLEEKPATKKMGMFKVNRIFDEFIHDGIFSE